MSIRDWPAAERPREKLLEQGAASLSDAELLAIFLRVGVRGRSAVDLARDMLGRFGGLRGLLETDRLSFSAELGLGTAKYAQLQAVMEMARRHLGESMKRGSALESPAAVRTYLKARLRHEADEVFGCLFLDTKHRPLEFEILFRGSIDSATVYPRQVVKRTLAHNAAALILCHNHPSGNPEPSQADIRLTHRLMDALETIDVRILDHFIVGDGEPLSMRERGCFFSAST
ncbi:RadC family protein [Pseudomonas wadenswilerensis]